VLKIKNTKTLKKAMKWADTFLQMFFCVSLSSYCLYFANKDKVWIDLFLFFGLLFIFSLIFFRYVSRRYLHLNERIKVLMKLENTYPKQYEKSRGETQAIGISVGYILFISLLHSWFIPLGILLLWLIYYMPKLSIR